MFQYRVNKSIDLGLEFRENLLISQRDSIRNFEGKLNNSHFSLVLEDNYLIQDFGKNLIQPLKSLQDIFKDIFDFDQYNSRNTILVDGTELFFSKEKKKLPKEDNKKPETFYYDIIYKKFEEKFKKYENQIERLDELLQTNEENKYSVIDVLKTINALKGLLEDIFNFSNHYDYKGNNERKIKGLHQFQIDKENIENFIKLLKTIIKKSKNGEQIAKIALNPVIVNTSGDINQKTFEDRINELQNTIIPKLEEEVRTLKNIKQEFLTGLDMYLNHILFEENFFKESKNYHYKENCKKFYEEIQNYTNSNNPRKSNDILKDFLHKNPIVKDTYKYNELEKDLIDEKYNIIKSQENRNDAEKIEGLNLEEIDFKNLNKIRYRLSWQKAEDKKLNKEIFEKKKEGEIKNLDKISSYIRIFKKEIRDKIEFYGSLYKLFLDNKRKKSQEYGQFRTEFIQKSNFSYENYGYDKFGLFIKKNDGIFYLYLIDKKDFKNKETLEEIKNLEKGEDTIYHFESLTPKGLYKLVFLKNAFSVDRRKFEYKYNYKGKGKIKTVKDLYVLKSKLNFKELNLFISYLKECIHSQKGKELFGNFSFDFQDKYDNLTDFEKDILKGGYIVKKQEINIDKLDENKLYKLTLNQANLDKNKGIDLNIFNLFLAGKYETTRMLPEIKLYYREQSIQVKEKEVGKDVKYQMKNKKIIHQERYTKPGIRANFLFELHPIDINNNPQTEKKNKFKEIQKKEALHYYGIDIGEKNFAIISRYDKDFNMVPIQVDGEEKQFLDLTNAKIENGNITINEKYQNDKKYVFFKEVFPKIQKYQEDLSEILEKIGEIDIGENYPKNLEEIKTQIGNSIGVDDFNYSQYLEISKKYFHGFSGLTNFILNFIKNYKKYNQDKTSLKLSEFYDEIYKKLEFFKITNFKEAFGSNFVGIIKQLLIEKPGIIVFENLWDNKFYEGKSSKERNISKSYGAYIGNYIFQSLFNGLSKIVENSEIKQYVYLDKNITNSLESESLYGYNGIIFWVQAEGTSSICPKCEGKIYRNKQDGVIKHDESCPGKNNCDFFIDEKNKKTYTFNSIQFENGDQVASYIIARNGKEYLKNPRKYEEVIETKIEKKQVYKKQNNNFNKGNYRKTPTEFKRKKTLPSNQK